MNPRIEKKASKRLVEIAPNYFTGAWKDNELPTDYADECGSNITGCMMMGGGVDYWGEGQDAHSVWEWHMTSWMFAKRFRITPEKDGWPDTGNFKPTVKNIIALIKEDTTND